MSTQGFGGRGKSLFGAGSGANNTALGGGQGGGGFSSFNTNRQNGPDNGGNQQARGFGRGTGAEFGGGRGGRENWGPSFGGGRGSSFAGGGTRRGGSNFGAGFGGDRRTKQQQQQDNSERRECKEFKSEEERAKERSHVPKQRGVAELYAEDERLKDQYLSIREEDSDVVLTGANADRYQQALDTWADADFDQKLLDNIARAQYTAPRKIQSRTIPLIVDGHDVKGHAETGSGKSAAFLLPIIDVIMKKKKAEQFESKRSCPYALVIEPTRELAIQLAEQARKLADGCDVSVSVAYGKFIRKVNLHEISTNGCDILIGTMGRLLDLFQKENLLFECLKILVLDEADQLLEDEFCLDLRKLAKVGGWPRNEERQTLLFSATFPEEVQRWANEWMRPDSLMVSNRKLVAANPRVEQRFVRANRVNKTNMLVDLLRREWEEAKQADPESPKFRPTMVFVKMKRSADVLSTYLNMSMKDLKTTTINGDRPQELREQSLDAFRKGAFRVIVSTDVCARGIDIKTLDHVINLDIPMEYTDYVQRIGRTGRVREGTATSFFDVDEDVPIAPRIVQGLTQGGQEVPDWLQAAAEGRPMPEEAERRREEASWGISSDGTEEGEQNGDGTGESTDSDVTLREHQTVESEESTDETVVESAENNDIPVGDQEAEKENVNSEEKANEAPEKSASPVAQEAVPSKPGVSKTVAEQSAGWGEEAENEGWD